MKHRQNEYGFSLIEATLCIIVIGIMAVIAVPKIVSTDRRAVYITARQITADMRYARGLAIAGAKDYIVRFYPKDGGHYGSYAIIFLNLHNEEISVKYKEIPGLVVCDIPTGGGSEWDIRFTRLGSASFDGSEEGVISLTVEGIHESINVTRATGRVWMVD